MFADPVREARQPQTHTDACAILEYLLQGGGISHLAGNGCMSYRSAPVRIGGTLISVVVMLVVVSRRPSLLPSTIRRAMQPPRPRITGRTWKLEASHPNPSTVGDERVKPKHWQQHRGGRHTRVYCTRRVVCRYYKSQSDTVYSHATMPAGCDPPLSRKPQSSRPALSS